MRLWPTVDIMGFSRLIWSQEQAFQTTNFRIRASATVWLRKWLSIYWAHIDWASCKCSLRRIRNDEHAPTVRGGLFCDRNTWLRFRV